MTTPDRRPTRRVHTDPAATQEPRPTPSGPLVELLTSDVTLSWARTCRAALLLLCWFGAPCFVLVVGTVLLRY